MKSPKKSLVILLLLWSIVAQAQTVQAQNAKQINYFTLYGGLSFSNTAGAFSLESIFYKNRGIGITREIERFITPNYPQPYNGGWFGDARPRTTVNFSTVSIIQKFSTAHQRIRFGTEIGISLVELKTPYFKYVRATTWLGESGYRIDNYTTEKATGIRLRASVDWLLTRSLGLELGIKSNINSLRSDLGVDIKFTTGFLRKRVTK